MNATIPLEKLRFPIGRFHKPERITADVLSQWISEIKSFPESLQKLSETLTPKSLNWKYRPDGWAVKQVIHHCADSHMNALIRVKLALTEENPTIKPYEESKWAELPDGISNDISASLSIIKGVHPRLATLFETLTSDQLSRTYFHPESKKSYRLDEVAGLYAWHGNHHLAHIAQALEYKGQFNTGAV